MLLVTRITAAVALVSAASLSAQAPAATRGPASVTLETQAGLVGVDRLAELDRPWGMAYLPDGRLLITERAGRLRIFDRGTLSAPISGAPAFNYRSQGGLYDVAVDPDFARNRYVYFSYTEAATEQPANAREEGDRRFGAFIDSTDALLKGSAVMRARLDGAALSDMQVIWRQRPMMIGRGHFAGRLAFGPDDKLYITSGDRQRFDPAQDTTGNVGKIVRINRDGSIPTDNPFGATASRDIWSLGHRNQLGMAFEPGTGKLYVHEMGPLGGDELNVIARGRNYGWPVVSNGDNYDGSHVPDHMTDKKFELPAHAWTPVISPSGLAFYTGTRFPQWRGSMLIGGLSSQSLIRVTMRGDRVANEERIYLGKRVRDVVQAPDGSVLLLTDGPLGELLRVSPATRRARR